MMGQMRRKLYACLSEKSDSYMLSAPVQVLLQKTMGSGVIHSILPVLAMDVQGYRGNSVFSNVQERKRF